MIKQLYIRNFTLIDELDIALHPGFSVVTGETGAGKSIILGAIGLLLGNRADTKQVKAGCDRCIIEAHFDLNRYHLEPFFEEYDIDYDAEDCIVRREISATGKSRAFINDTPVSLAQLRELGEQLVDIHSQHQNLLLGKEDFQLGVVDVIAADKVAVSDYREYFLRYQEALKAYDVFEQELARSRQNEDFMRFQLQELTDAALQEGELEQLEEQSNTMSHSEEIKSALFEAAHLLQNDESGVVMTARRMASLLHGISRLYPVADELATRLDSCHIELKDIADEVDNRLEAIDFDPRQQIEVNQRLDRIYSLQQKHHVDSVEELISLRDQLDRQLAAIDNSDEELAQLRQKVDTLEQQCHKKAAALTLLRQKAARQVEQEMQNRLVPLGIPNVRFKIELTEKPLGLDGADKVAFLFSANKSTPLQPVSSVASGGEVARVMLSLKAMISGAVKLPTIIFDEIDTGVSGRVAEQMAHLMREMGDHERQVMSITHLPQIAALGTTHYRVAKVETEQGTKSSMTELSPAERINEIAQMLSGSDVTQAAIDNAKQLLKTK